MGCFHKSTVRILFIYTCIYIHTQIHRYIDTHTHTQMHTYTIISQTFKMSERANAKKKKREKGELRAGAVHVCPCV